MPKAQPCRDGMSVLYFLDISLWLDTKAMAGFGSLSPSCYTALFKMFGSSPRSEFCPELY